MRVSDLVGFLRGERSPSQLKIDLATLYGERDGVHTRVLLEGNEETEQPVHVVGANDLRRICRLALEGPLDPSDLSAFADALLFCFCIDFEDHPQDMYASIADMWSSPEINYPLDENRVAMFESWIDKGVMPNA